MERGMVSAVVLAGGRSSRFGGNKLDAMVDGRPLLQRAIEAVAEVADEVIVVAAADGPAPYLPATPVPIRLVRDADPFPGPLVGLLTGATAARHAVLLVVGGDMPTLVPAVLRLLIDPVVAGRQAAALDGREGPTGDGPGAGDGDPVPTPLPLALDRQAAIVHGARGLAAGDRSLRALIAMLDISVIRGAAWRAGDPDGATLRDVDRRDDLPPAG